MTKREGPENPTTLRGVYWGVGIGLAIVLIAVVAAWSLFEVRAEQQKQEAQRKAIERQQLADQLKMFAANEQKFMREHDVLLLLEELQDSSELYSREMFSDRGSDRSTLNAGQRYFEVRGLLSKFFSDEDLNFMMIRTNRYTKKYGEVRRAGIIKANKEMQDRINELQKLRDALRALEASSKTPK